MSLFFELSEKEVRDKYWIEATSKYSFRDPFRDAKHQEAYKSLLQNLKDVCKEAGGNIKGISMEETSAFELLSTLCTNNIKFIYTKPSS